MGRHAAIAWVTCGFFAAGCGAAAKPMHVDLGRAVTAGEAPATLVIQFTHEVSGAHLTIDGEAIVAGETTSRITVAGLASGELSIMLAADGGIEKSFRVELEPGQRMTVPVAAPAPHKGVHPLVQALLTVSVYAAYLGLASLL